MCEALLKRGADIEALNSLKQTPLHHALMHRNVKVALFLLEQGAKKLDTEDVFCYSMANYAARVNDSELLKKLA